jgi:hypothetical protein
MGKFTSFNKFYLHRKFDSMYHAKICKLGSQFTAKIEQALVVPHMGKYVRALFVNWNRIIDFLKS